MCKRAIAFVCVRLRACVLACVRARARVCVFLRVRPYVRACFSLFLGGVVLITFLIAWKGVGVGVSNDYECLHVWRIQKICY